MSPFGEDLRRRNAFTDRAVNIRSFPHTGSRPPKVHIIWDVSPEQMVSIRASETETPSSAVSPPLREAVSQLFEKLRTWSMKRVEEVNQMTSTESLAAGDSLNSIVNQSQSYVDHLRKAMSRFTVSANDNGAHEVSAMSAIEEQGAMLDAYLQNLESALASQEKVARVALQQLEAMRCVGAHILEISHQASTLAVNARTQAARLNDSDGEALSVIADKMSGFSTNIQGHSDEIVEVIQSLSLSLPVISEITETLRARTAVFSQESSEKNSEVSSVVHQLQSTIRDVLQQGDERIATILKHSQEALSHLQFQDPCAQRLMQIEADVLQAERAALSVLETGDVSIVERVNAAQSHRTAAVGHVMIFDQGVDAESPDSAKALPAGELLLF